MASRSLLLLALLSAAAATRLPTASSVCVTNHGQFLLRWRLQELHTGNTGPSTLSYPPGVTKCRAIAELDQPAAVVRPEITADFGKPVLPLGAVAFEPANATQLRYSCSGTSGNVTCRVLTELAAEPTVAGIVAEVEAFTLGFAEGLGVEIGFAACLPDVNATYVDIEAVVKYFETGFNIKDLDSIVKAFELLAKMLGDFVKAIPDCVKGAEALVAKIKDIIGALSGNPMDILKVVAKDAIHIWQDRTEITTDCKAVVADWQGQDFNGAGKAVGDIVGIIIAGL